MAETTNKPKKKPKQQEEPNLRRRKPSPKSNVAAPDLTPMIDVTFQLLIYFLITATYIPDEGQIPGSLPSNHGNPTTSPVRPVELSVSEGSDMTGETASYTLGGRSTTDPDELYKRLVARRTSDKHPLVIKVSPRCKWRFVVEAFNQGTRANYKKIGFKQ